MVKSQRKKLGNKYAPFFLAILILFCYSGYAQTYHPTAHIVANDAIGIAQATPIDSRSMFYDSVHAKYRDYNGTSEVLSYLNLGTYRFGHTPIFVHVGGTLSAGVWTGGIAQIWWFKNGTADSNLVRWYSDSTGGACAGCLLAANNLSDVLNAATARTNLVLGNVDNTSDATKWAATATLTNKSISGITNTFSNIPNSALSNNSIGLTVGTSGSDVNVSATPAALGSSLILNIPTAGTGTRGALSAANWNYFNGKIDSIHVSNDSLFDFTGGVGTFRGAFPGASSVISVSNSDGTLTISPIVGNVVASLNLSHANTWSGTQTFNGVVMAGQISFSANNTWSIGSGIQAAAHVWSRIFNSDASVTVSSTIGNSASLAIGPTSGITLLASGQAQFNNYTTSTSFTGTPLAFLQTDASGNIIQTPIGNIQVLLGNEGIGYRLFDPVTNKMKTLTCSGCTLDSATAGQINITASGGGSDSGIAVLNGILATRTAGPTVFLQVDSGAYATRARVQKGIDSLGAIKGTVSNFLFTNANGFSGSVSTSTTTPTLTLSTSVTGLIFGNGTAMAAATVNSPLTYSAGTLGIQVANTSQNGYLSSADWNTFNNKQGAVTLTTTGTSGAATFITNTLNIPQYQGALTLTTTGSSGPATLVSNTLNIPQYTGGGGAQTLSINTRGDSLTISGGNTVAQDPNPHNTGWYNLHILHYNMALFAPTLDSTNYTGTADSIQIKHAGIGNSMMEHPDLGEQSYINLMNNRYPTFAAGPGFIGMGNNRKYFTVTIPASSWTSRNAFTVPAGRGIDTYEAISNGGGSDSISVGIAANLRSIQYNQSTVVEVWWYGVSGGGTFRINIDGTTYPNINTASATGPQRTIIRGLSKTAHIIYIAPITQGTAGISILGFNCYLAGQRGWTYEKIAKGASTVSNWTAMNASDWITQISWLGLTEAWTDWVVTSMGVMDSAAYRTGLDTMVHRLRAATPNIDIAVIGGTPYAYHTFGNPVSSLEAYNRTIKRYAYDNKCAYWSPFMIYGDTSNLATDVSTGILATDTLHRTAQGEIIEMSQQLSAWGAYGMTIPDYSGNLYTKDSSLTGTRTMNGRGFSLRFDSLTAFRIGGKTTFPVINFDFTSTSQVAVTMGKPWQMDQNISTSGVISASGTATAHSFNGAVVINGAVLPSSRTFALANTSYAFAAAITTSTSAASGWENRVQGQAAPAGSFTSQGTGAIDAIRAANATAVQSFNGDMNIGTSATSKRTRIFSTNSGGTIIDVADATENGNWLVGSGTDVSNSLFTVVSTTKASIPLPKMTTTQKNAISSPVDGMTVYDVTLEAPYYYNATTTTWTPFAGAGGGLTGSGTTNLVSKWTSSTALGNSVIEDSAGYVGINTFPDATSTFTLVVGGKNSKFTTWNGTSSAGYISTNQSSGNLRLEFHRTGSSGTNGIYFDQGSTITENASTGEIQHFAPSGGFFPSWYANNSEFMRGTAGGHLLVGTTSDVSTSKFTVVSTTLGSVPMPSMTTTQKNAISSPAEALMVYDNVLHAPYYFNGTAWTAFGGGGSQTWDQVLTTGSTLVGAHTVTNTGQTFIWDNGGTGTFKFNNILSDTTNAQYLLAKKKDSSVFEMPFSALSQYLPADTLTGGQAIKITQASSTNFTVNLGGNLTQTDTVTFSASKTLLWQNSGNFVDGSVFQVNTSAFEVYGAYAFGGWILTTSTGTVTITMAGMSQGGGQLIDPASAISSLTFQLPATGNVVDGYVLNIHFGGQIATGSNVATSITWTPNSGQSIIGTMPSSAVSGDYISLKFYAASQRWYREH